MSINGSLFLLNIYLLRGQKKNPNRAYGKVCYSLYPQVATLHVSRFCGTLNQGKRSHVTMEMASLEKTTNSVNAILAKGIVSLLHGN